MATAEELLAQLAAAGAAAGTAGLTVRSEELLAALTETARQMFGAAACSLALLSDDEEELVYTVASGQGAEDVTGLRMPADRGIAGYVAQSGQPVAISDTSGDTRFAREVAEDTGYVPSAILAVPVASARRLIGVLSLLDRDAARQGAENDLATAAVFAEQAALAIEAAEQAGDLGRLLLEAVSRAAGEGSDLADAADRLAAGAPAVDADLAELCALLADLGRQGPAERRLAVSVTRLVAGYTAGRRAGR